MRRTKQEALVMHKIMNEVTPKYRPRIFTQRYGAYNLKNLEGKLSLPNQLLVI